MLKKLIFTQLKKKREVFPRLLSIELSSSCNAKCIMCPHPDLMTRRKQNMSSEILDKIISDCKGKPLKKVNLFWFGDSLCNKHVIDHFRAIRAGLPGVKLYLSSNSELLSADRSRAIIDERLVDVINFDIDGVTAETHEYIRKVSYEKVVENVQFFLDYLQKSPQKGKIQTRATIINMKENTTEVEPFVELWQGKVDKVDVNKYNTWLGDIEDRNVSTERSAPLSQKFDFACQHPWDELVISSEGEGGLCCLDYDLKAPLGSVMEQTVQEIWQSPMLQGYRQKMLNHQYDQIDVCKNCNAHIFQHKSTWAKLQR